MAQLRIYKLTVNLSADIVTAIREIAAKRGTTMTSVIRQAIGTEKFFQDAKEKNEKVLVEDSRGNLRQLVLR